MPDRLTVSFEYSPVEHVTALDESPNRQAIMKWFRPGMVAVVVLGFAMAAVRGNFSDDPVVLLLTVVSVLPLVVLALLMPNIAKRLEIARFRRARAGCADEIETRHFGREGFTPGRDLNQLIPWPMITRVVESDDFYFFYDALSEIPEYVPTGGTYINFLTEDEGPERIEAALGKGLERLAEIKAKWDPQNVFRTNRNIKPA